MSNALDNLVDAVKTSVSSRSVWAVIGLVLLATIFTYCSDNNQNGVDGSNADAAPDFELELLSNVNHNKGSKLQLSDLHGTPVVINFWYPSCPPCRFEIPDFETSYNLHKGDVEFIGVMSLILDTVEEGQDFIDEFGITYAVGPDPGNTATDYEIIGFPTTVFLGRNHHVIRKWTGTLNANKLEDLVEEILTIGSP